MASVIMTVVMVTCEELFELQRGITRQLQAGPLPPQPQLGFAATTALPSAKAGHEGALPQGCPALPSRVRSPPATLPQFPAQLNDLQN